MASEPTLSVTSLHSVSRASARVSHLGTDDPLTVAPTHNGLMVEVVGTI